jgi:23S rRNA A2030 N6-methylase RlmJ
MEVKYTKHFLNKLEDIFAESDYTLRYEKGNFKSGYCVLNQSKIVVINKYYTLEGKISCLLDIIKEVELDSSGFSEKNQKLFKTS